MAGYAVLFLIADGACMSDITLYGYWRSSAAYRVRIALNLKGVGYRDHPVHLIQDGGQQHRPEYHALNPLDVVPTLIHGRDVLTQSMAIIEYIDEIYPDPPLLPVDALGRARVRALAQVIGCDVHPVANLRVLQYLEKQFGDKADKAEWSRHWIVAGLAAFEQLVAGDRRTGRFCHGDTPGIADLVLVPQLYNAVRWGVPLGDYPTLLRIKAACDELEAFARAVPEVQRDAPSIAS